MTARKSDRVRLIHTTDRYTKLRPGTLGTVTFVDDAGTVHVRWDDGSSLGMIAEAGDRFEIVESRPATYWSDTLKRYVTIPED